MATNTLKQALEMVYSDMKSVRNSTLEASKDYTDKKAQEILWKVGEYDITTQNDNTTALVKTAPSGATRIKIKRVSGNCVKYAPSTASDDSVAKDKVIPENTYTTELNILGGMSYKSENLINITGTNYNNTGGTVTISTDGTITISNIQRTGSIAFNHNLSILANTTLTWKLFDYKLSSYLRCNVRYNEGDAYTYNTPNLSTSNSYSANYTYAYNTYSIQVELNVTNDDVTRGYITFKLMVVKGSTAPTTYQPYFEDIRDTATTSMITSGNLLNIPDVAETTTNGITYKVENGVITLNGTATTGFTIYLLTNENIVNSNGLVHALFINSNNTNPTKVVEFNLSTTNYGYESQVRFQPSNYTSDKLTQVKSADGSILKTYRIWIPNGSVFNNCAIKPMLVKGSTVPTVYKPYVAPITKTIPQEIQALTGYGWGVNSSIYNYITLNTKKFIQKVARVKAKDLTWAKYGNNFYGTITDGKHYTTNVIPILCSLYNAIAWKDRGNAQDLDMWDGFDVNAVIIKDSRFENTTTFKNHFTDDDYIYYELATPIETDISSLLPADFNKIATNNNYTNIEFISEYGYDIPNKLSYYGTIKETLCTAINKNDALAISLTNNEEKYGWSVGSIYNTRDYTTIKGSQKVGRVVLNGSENWIYDSASGKEWFYISSNSKQNSSTINCLSSYLTEVSRDDIGNIDNVICTNGVIIIRMSQFNGDITAFKEWLSNNNITLYYWLATEGVEDITPLENNVIEVVENDELGFVNSENQAVPSEITYRIEVEK